MIFNNQFDPDAEEGSDDTCDCCDDECECGDCEECGKDDDDEGIVEPGSEKDEEPASNLYGQAITKKDDDYDDGYRDDL